MKHIKRKTFFLHFLAAAICLSAYNSPQPSDRKNQVVAALHNYLEKYSAEMLSALDTFGKIVPAEIKNDSAEMASLKRSFLELRKSYKKIEPFSCYYFLASERNFNGPVVSEIEDESEEFPKVELPHGLQVIESYLWNDDPGAHRGQLVEEINLLHENLSSLSIAFKTLPTDEIKFIEAIQLEVIRIFTLGIPQFDTPASKDYIRESMAALSGIGEVIRIAYGAESANPYVSDVLMQLKHCSSFFSNISQIRIQDFLSCYRNYYIPLSKSLTSLRDHFVENNYYTSSALAFNVPSIFQTDAFNRFFYNPRGTNPEFSEEAAALGKALFFDPVLSENNMRACASCHQPERAFTDGMKTSNGFLKGEMLSRNAPTLINAALQRNYFFDMRADHLEGQIGHVLTNKNEMQSSFESAVKKLNTSPAYVNWFRKAFAGKEDTLISKTSIENAISEYERTLVSLNSKFDKNVRGEEDSFSETEKAGFNIFMDKGRCATCHYLPLFNNVVPPQYTRSEFEIIGTTASFDTVHPVLDADKGRGGLYGTKIFMHAFKTPTLRNIALTAPYMHNGAFESLEQVIEFYNNGGGAGMGLNVPNQTLSSDSLHLTTKEKKELLAFLNTLTDTNGLTSKPQRLPAFLQPSLNNRRIGGEY